MISRHITLLLAAIFLSSGGAKLAGLAFEVEAFARWGYPLSFMYLTGILEVAGAIGLLLRRISALAASCLATLMIGAVATHIIHAEWFMVPVASVIMALSAWRGWAARNEIFLLFSARSRRPN